MNIEHLYSPKLFASLAASAQNIWADFLRRAQNGDQVSLGDRELKDLKNIASSLMSDVPNENLERRFEILFKFFFDHMTQLHNPRYIGHQTCAPIPPAALFQAIGLISNQSAALSELSPSSTAIERAVIEKLCNKIGWGSAADGFSTNGGTLANVTAVLAALNVKYPTFWTEGFKSFKGKTPILIASSESHYCVERACGMLGLGTDNMVKIPIDERRKISISALESYLNSYDRNLYEPFCVVATSGATPTGSFDDLQGVVKVAKEHNLWVHVDGAHGASMLMSEKYKKLCAGIDQVDSVTWDGHKMMFTPSLATFLLFKERANSFKTFKPNAPYLFMPGSVDDEKLIFDGAHRTLECTRQSMALGLWGVWALFGENTFSKLIDRCNDLTKYFWKLLNDAKDFETVHDPECNILCFEYVGEQKNRSPEKRALLQQKIRQELLDESRFYITGTVIEGIYRLRVTVINPLTKEEHFSELMENIREIASRIN